MDRLQIARKFSDALLERFGSKISSVILFGSVARGTDREESDIDLVVITNDPMMDQKIDDLVVDFVLDYGELPVPLVYSREGFEKKRDFSFYKTLMNEGKVLYGKGVGSTS